LPCSFISFYLHAIYASGFMECEICGAETDTLYEIEIEGTHMYVCSVCAKGKHLTGYVETEGNKAKSSPLARGGGPAAHAPFEQSFKRAGADADYELVEDYGSKIRNAREALGLPLKVLAEKINEKASMLLRVEEQKTLPSDVLVKKLEKELGIKLTAPAPAKSGAASSKGRGPVTIGDFAAKNENKEE